MLQMTLQQGYQSVQQCHPLDTVYAPFQGQRQTNPGLQIFRPCIKEAFLSWLPSSFGR